MLTLPGLGDEREFVPFRIVESGHYGGIITEVKAFEDKEKTIPLLSSTGRHKLQVRLEINKTFNPALDEFKGESVLHSVSIEQGSRGNLLRLCSSAGLDIDAKSEQLNEELLVGRRVEFDVVKSDHPSKPGMQMNSITGVYPWKI